MLLMALLGASTGLLGAIGIYFAPDEPYKHQVVAAGTLRGAMVGLLVGLSMNAATTFGTASLLGLLYGAASGLMIWLAKGGPSSGDAPFVIPVGAITGALTGLLVKWLIF